MPERKFARNLQIGATDAGHVVIIADGETLYISHAMAVHAAEESRRVGACRCATPCEIEIWTLEGECCAFGGTHASHAEMAEHLSACAAIAEQYLPGAGHA